MGRSTLSIQDETKQEFDALKPDNASQDEFLQELLDAYQTHDTPESKDRTDEILNRLDDLEATLPQKTAETLEHRLR